MIQPDIWFTLYALAKRGAIHNRIIMTTTEIGTNLGISQQTASRRVTKCVEEGYLARAHAVDGMRLKITEKGRNELRKTFSSLEIAFAPPKEEIVIEGAVVGGIGEGAYYVDVYSDRFEENLGFKPYPGTLNVKVTNEQSIVAINRMKHTAPIIVGGFSHEGRTFGDVICYRVRINEKLEGAIVIAQRTHHSPETLEVIAPVNIRKKLKLKDDDTVKLRVVPLHLAI